jgi:hypothetical protein
MHPASTRLQACRPAETTAPYPGGLPSSYVLKAGLAPGETIISLSLPTTEWSYVARGVTPGTYYVRLRAVNAFGRSGASDDVEIVVTESSDSPLPGQPGLLHGWMSGSRLTLTWESPSEGASVTGYVVEAGSAPGLSNIATFALNARAFTFLPVPAGFYFVRVRAMSAHGLGPPSDEILINHLGSFQGRRWHPGSIGQSSTAAPSPSHGRAPHAAPRRRATWCAQAPRPGDGTWRKRTSERGRRPASWACHPGAITCGFTARLAQGWVSRRTRCWSWCGDHRPPDGVRSIGSRLCRRLLNCRSTSRGGLAPTDLRHPPAAFHRNAGRCTKVAWLSNCNCNFSSGAHGLREQRGG